MEKNQYSLLIADDDTFIRETLRILLRDSEFNVIGEASHGDIAFDLCKSLRPRLVLLDINMPGKDGLAVLEQVQALKIHTQFIMISADATLDKVKRALALGALGFLVKPLKPGKVLDEIQKCFERASGKS
jgi:two-component system chemotaxis response regulator CheY